jgi:hypothetical protein
MHPIRVAVLPVGYGLIASACSAIECGNLA